MDPTYRAYSYSALLAIISCAMLSAAVLGEEPAMLPRVGVSDATAIVKAGKANAVIVYPADDAAYAAVAEKVRQAVRQATGVDLEAHVASDVLAAQFVIAPKYKQRNLILLGSLNTNPALVQLGARACLYATSKWPGENGFELRTVTNPFGTKANCLVLGGSDVTGVGMAADRFIEVIGGAQAGAELVVPRLCRIVIKGVDQTAADARPFDNSGPNGTYGVAGTIERYQTTGSTAQLEVVRTMLGKYLAQNKPPAASDYGTESAVRALDLVDSFALTDQQNLQMDRLLLGWVVKIVTDRPYWNAQGRNWSFGGHQACGAMSFLAVTGYLLQNGNPNDAARQMLESQRVGAHQFLRYLSTSFKDSQKDVGWETWTPLAVPGRYALIEGDMTFFDQGVMKSVVQRHFYAGGEFGPAAIAAFVFNDGRYKSLGGEATLSGWAYVLGGPHFVTPPELAPATPDFLIGTKVMPSSITDWEHAHGNAPAPSSWHTQLAHDKTFHVIGFTDGVGKDDTKLVLGGWDSRGNPGEANSIRTFSQGGHRYLFRADGNDNRKPRPGRFYQNSIVVEAASYDVAPPCAAELLAHHDAAQGGFSASRLNDYNGVDWERRIFWRRGRYFVVLDRCRAKRAGPVTIVNQWWSGDAPGLHGDRWTAQTDAGTFQLVMSDAGTVSSKQWRNGGAHQLRQVKHVKAEAGDEVSYLNLFYVDGKDAGQRYEIRRAGNSALLVKGSYQVEAGEVTELALIGYGGDDASFAAGPIKVDAAMFLISPSVVMVDADGSVQLGDEVVTLDQQGVPNEAHAQRLVEALRQLWDQHDQAPASIAATAPPEQVLKVTKLRSMEIETGYRPISGVAFERHEDGAITWDLGQPRQITSIEGIRIKGSTANVRYGTEKLTEKSPVIVATKGLDLQWVYYQYGFSASLDIQALGPINQTGRYFRIELPEGEKLAHGRGIYQHWHRQAWNVTGHNRELFNRPVWQDVVFRSDEPDVSYTHSKVVDLDGDGNDELIVATDRDELLMIAIDGTVSWKHKFDAAVTNLICEDLYGNGKRQVLCTTKDAVLHIFSPDGKTHTRADKMPFSGLNSLSLRIEPNGERGLYVGTYHHMLKLDTQAEMVDTVSGSGFYQDTMPAVSWDVTGDGVPDVLLRENVWGLVSLLDGVSFKAIASHRTNHLGRGLAMVPWPAPGGGRAGRFLVIAESGLAMLEATGEKGDPLSGDAATIVGGIRSIFGIPMAPIVDLAVADVDGDGANEIIVANFYGAIVILDERGKAVASTVAAPELHDIAVVPHPGAPATILAATNVGLLEFDHQLNLRAAADDVTECRKVEVLTIAGTPKTLGLFANGDVAIVAE
jgi:hypothetical protein